MRAILFLLVAAGALRSQPETFDLAPAPGTKFSLTVEKTGLWSGRKHVFEFQQYSGTLRFDRAAPSRSEVELVIDAKSAVCNDAWLSVKDRKKVLDFMFTEMLDVERNPRLSFRSTMVAAAGEKTFRVTGVLTVRGIERPAEVAVAIEETGAVLTAAAGRATIRMKDYGLKPPKAALGAIGTRDEMTVDFRLAPRPARSHSQ